MIALLAMFLAVSPPPLSLSPFMDEERAARAVEAHLVCLGSVAFDRRNDERATEALAAEVVRACVAEAAVLRAALSDVFRRKPELIPATIGADEAADSYVRDMNSRVEAVIQHERERRQHAQDR